MSYHVISYHIMSYHIMSYHVISYHVMSYHVISCHIRSCHVISCHVMPYAHIHITSYPHPPTPTTPPHIPSNHIPFDRITPLCTTLLPISVGLHFYCLCHHLLSLLLLLVPRPCQTDHKLRRRSSSKNAGLGDGADAAVPHPCSPTHTTERSRRLASLASVVCMLMGAGGQHGCSMKASGTTLAHITHEMKLHTMKLYANTCQRRPGTSANALLTSAKASPSRRAS